MSERTKRTYNLSVSTVRRVREMADAYGVASSQDAVIELAVDELDRRLREVVESAAWEAAKADPELRDLELAYESADRETWPA